MPLHGHPRRSGATIWDPCPNRWVRAGRKGSLQPAEWILNQVQDDVSGGGAEDEGSFQLQRHFLECHPDPESSSGQANEPASAIQDPEKAPAARGPAGAAPRSGQYVDDPVNNKSRLQPVINDYHHLELCA